MPFQLTAKLHQILPSPTLVVSATSVASASRDATRCSGGGSPPPTKPPQPWDDGTLPATPGLFRYEVTCVYGHVLHVQYMYYAYDIICPCM